MGPPPPPNPNPNPNPSPLTLTLALALALTLTLTLTSAPGGLRSAKSTPALSKAQASVGSTNSLLEEVVGPGGKVTVTARAPPRPPEPVLTAAEKKAKAEAAKPRMSLGTLQLKKAEALERQL